MRVSLLDYPAHYLPARKHWTPRMLLVAYVEKDVERGEQGRHLIIHVQMNLRIVVARTAQLAKRIPSSAWPSQISCLTSDLPRGKNHRRASCKTRGDEWHVEVMSRQQD